MASQLRALVLLVVCGLASTVMAEGRPPYGQLVNGSLLEEPLVTDPVAVRTHTDLTVVSMVFDTLYRVRGGGIEPHLAGELPDASDPLNVIVSLREGVLFHDGSRLRGSDVVASIERLRKSSVGYFLGSVTSVELLPIAEEQSAEQIVFHLRFPDLKLAKRLCDVHTSVTMKGKPPSWRRMVGSGPFRLKERSSARRELRLLAFEKHFAGRSYVDEVKLRWHEDRASEARIYETGGMQVSMRGDIAFAGHKPKYRTKQMEAAPSVLAYLGFGRNQKITQDKRFRAAVSAAIGRLGMSQIGSGERVSPTTSPLPLSLRKSSAQSGLTVDRRKVGRLFAAMTPTYPQLDAGTVSLELIVNKSRPDDVVIAGRIAAALFAFGVRTHIVALHAAAFFRRARLGQCDLYIGQLAPTSYSGGDILRTAFAISGRSVKGNRATLEQRFVSDLPIVPLFHRGVRVHHRSDLHGLSFTRLVPGRIGTRLMYENLFLFGSPERN